MTQAVQQSRRADAEDRLTSFLSWFQEHGGYLNPSIRLTLDDDGQQSLVVRQGHNIAAHETIVSCPHDITFSIATATRIRRRNNLPLGLDTSILPRLVALRLCLVDEFLLGERSYWTPYIQCLPQPYQKDNFCTPAYFDDEDRLWLRGTNLDHAAQARLEVWKEEFSEARVVLQHLSREQRELWTCDLYVWAATIITTRGFPAAASSEKSLGLPVLVPGLDLMNHSLSAKVAWDWGPKSCAISTDETVMGGRPILNNYGPKSNEELLMGYGFCLDPNPADTYNLSYSSALEQRIAVERRQNSSESGRIANPSTRCSIADIDSDLPREIHYVCFRPPDNCNSHGSSDETPSYAFSAGLITDFSLVLRNARERDPSTASAVVPPQHATSFLPTGLTRNKLHVLSVLFMILQEKRAGIHKHDDLLPSRPKGKKQQYAAVYRASQLRILEGVLDGLGEALATLTHSDLHNSRGGESPSIEPSQPGERYSSHVIRLPDILTFSTDSSVSALSKRLTHDLRAVVHAGLNTRDPPKIVRRGGEEFAFAMWTCGLFLLLRSEPGLPSVEAEIGGKLLTPCGDHEQDANLPAWVKQWFRNLQSWYPFASTTSSGTEVRPSTPLVSTSEAASRSHRDSVDTSLAEATNDDLDEMISSYLDAVEGTIRKHPKSLFNAPGEVTRDRVSWCLSVVRGEGLRCPFSRGDGEEREDEFVLVAEVV